MHLQGVALKENLLIQKMVAEKGVGQRADLDGAERQGNSRERCATVAMTSAVAGEPEDAEPNQNGSH